MTGDPQDYRSEAGSYKDVQKHIEAGGVPVMTSITQIQRKHLERQIITLYPDILNTQEAEKVKFLTFISQISGFGMIFGTPYSLILFQKASQEVGGSNIRKILINRAIGVQLFVLASSYWTFKQTTKCLDNYSKKYLQGLDDTQILNFEKQDPKEINQKANINNLV